MKVLIAGAWIAEIHEEAVCRALSDLGHDTTRFDWQSFFDQASNVRHLPTLGRVAARAQGKFLVGPVVARINREFVDSVGRSKPDLVFLYRNTLISRRSLIELRRSQPGIVIVAYCNDDPFASGHPWYLWRRFKRSLPEYDVVFAYRPDSVPEYRVHGARRVEVLRSWYLPHRNRPVALTTEERIRFGADVLFIGHYERDGRQEALERLVLEGLDVRVFGPEWHRAGKESALGDVRSIVALRGNDYNKAICGAKIVLCFLSKLNRDTYTRRCFEIPAAGAFLLAEHTSDLASLYEEGREAEFFRTTEEMISKAKYYLTHEQKRNQIARAGMARLLRDGHDPSSRMKRLLGIVESLRHPASS